MLSDNEVNFKDLIKKDYRLIALIENPTEEQQLVAVKKSSRAIQFIKNPTEKVQLAAVRKMPSSIQFIKNPSETVQLTAFKKNDYILTYIPAEFVSEALQLAMVNYYGPSISDIFNKGIIPSKDVQLAAIKNRAMVIANILGNGIIPSEEFQLVAVSNDFEDGKVIRQLYKYDIIPTNAVNLAAVKHCGLAIKEIPTEFQTEEIRLAAVKQNGYAIRYIPYSLQTNEVQLAAVKQNSGVIKCIPEKYLCEELQLELLRVTKDPGIINLIPNPSEAVQIAVVQENPDALWNIKNPSGAVQLAAVTRSGIAIRWIHDCFLESVQLAAIQQWQEAIKYIPPYFQTEAVQLAAVRKDLNAYHLIELPFESVTQLYNEIRNK